MKTIPLTESEINHIKETYSQELERLQKRAKEISSILNKLSGQSEVSQIVEEGKKPEEKVEETIIPSKRKYTRKAPASIIPTTEEAILPQVIENTEKPKAKRGRPFKVKTEVDQTLAEETAKPEKKKPGRKKTEKVKSEKIASGNRGRKKSPDSKRSRWTNAILEILQEQEKMLSSREIIEEIMKKQNIIASDYSKTRAIVNGSLTDLKQEQLKTIKNPKVKGSLYGLTEWFNEAGALVDETKLPND